MTPPANNRNLESENDKEQLGKWLVDKAPKNIGPDKRSIERTKKLVAAIIKRYPAARFEDIYYCLSNWWVLRCTPGLSPQALTSIVSDEFDAAVLDGRRKSKNGYEQRHLENIAKKRRAEKRRDNGQLLTKLADTLRCSTRYARMLISDGTTDRSTAKTMARILNTKADDHLRTKLRTGRQADLVGWFMKVWIPNSSFRNFIDEDPSDLPVKTWDLLETLREQVGTLKAEQSQINSLENLIAHCRLLNCDYSITEGATEIWQAYKLWKIEVISEHAIRIVKEGHWSDVMERDNRTGRWK